MDAILYWNDVALEANRVSHSNGKNEQTGPPLSARALAIVHLATHDAFVGTATAPPFASYLGVAPVLNASVDAAIADAARVTLTVLFPSQKAFFEARYSQFVPAGNSSEVSVGAAYGEKIAKAILADRSSDPGVSDVGYVTSSLPLHHRSDPDNPQGVHAPHYGALSKCFAVSARHALAAPPAKTTPAYVNALRQVRRLGIAPELMGTLPTGSQRRTIDETAIGLFWAYDGAKELGTPPRLYNQVIRKVAEAQANTLAKNARLFALVNAAMADAGILAWEQKFRHDLWRPVVGIREHDVSMGPMGTPNNNLSDDTDPGWLPLGAPATNELKKNVTPPFPAYPSGHATFGAAAFDVTRRFYGAPLNAPDALANNLGFVSDELNGVSADNKGATRPRHMRAFADGMWQMIRENSISRVFLGVHWIYDGYAPTPTGAMDLTQNVGGVPLGLAIAKDIFTTGLVKSTV